MVNSLSSFFLMISHMPPAQQTTKVTEQYVLDDTGKSDTATVSFTKFSFSLCLIHLPFTVIWSSASGWKNAELIAFS